MPPSTTDPYIYNSPYQVGGQTQYYSGPKSGLPNTITTPPTTLASQTYTGRYVMLNSGASVGNADVSEGTTAFNFANASTLAIVMQSANGNGSCTLSNFTMEVNL